MKPNEGSNSCKLCIEVNPKFAHTHELSTCNRLNQSDRRQVTRAILAQDPEEEDYTYPTYEHDYVEDTGEIDSEETASASAAMLVPSNVHRIHRINVHESPILACSSGTSIVYVILDTGATASLITIKKAKFLNLQIYPTSQKAVQVDGETDLPILGEVHTRFKRGNISLKFDGLVVSTLGVDILGGTNFHIDNDIYSRMSKGTIHVGDSHVFQSTPPALLSMNTTVGPSQCLVKVSKTLTLLPGDSTTFSAPPHMDPEYHVMVELNLDQTTPFFNSQIIQLTNSKFEIENSSNMAVTLKKNCQAIRLYRTISPQSDVKYLPKPPPITPNIRDIDISVETPSSTKSELLKVAADFCEVFDGTLPGYNGAFGPVFADFNFASRARPSAQKLQSPAYGSCQELLFNEKCKLLKSQNVLIDPQEHCINQSLAHNSSVVRKPSSACKSWEECNVNDVRLVVGLDPLNKFLKDPPEK